MCYTDTHCLHVKHKQSEYTLRLSCTVCATTGPVISPTAIPTGLVPPSKRSSLKDRFNVFLEKKKSSFSFSTSLIVLRSATHDQQCSARKKKVSKRRLAAWPPGADWSQSRLILAKNATLQPRLSECYTLTS